MNLGVLFVSETNIYLGLTPKGPKPFFYEKTLKIAISIAISKKI